MVIKIIYVLIFAAANFVVYSLLNRTGTVNRKQGLIFAGLFLLFILFQSGLFNWALPMAPGDFFPVTLLLVVPVIVYLWFHYMVVRRIQRLNGGGQGFLGTAAKAMAFFFLKFFYIIVLIAQADFIFNPISTLK
jgi:hypothetical protein